MSKAQSHRDSVIKEVYTSEQSYFDAMQKCLDQIIDPLYQKNSSREITIPETITVLFEKYKSVVKVSSNFINNMKAFIDAGQQISIMTVFGTFKDEIVTEYFQNIQLYHDVMPKIFAERAKNSQFNNFLTEKETELQVTFQSFLILPIQRLPRYRLLLQEIIKYTEQSSPDLPVLQEILTAICEALSAVDQKMEEMEESLKFEEIQSKIIGFDVFNKVGRHLLFEGDVMKFSRKEQQSRRLYLFTDCLIITEESLLKAITRPYKLNKSYNAGDYTLTPINDYRTFINSIQIRTIVKSATINMRTAKDKGEIMSMFEKVKTSNPREYSGSHAKVFAPVWIPDDFAPTCMHCGGKFTVINRKHHCRCCGKCICKTCSKFNDLIPFLNEREPQKVCNVCHTELTKLWANPGAFDTEKERIVNQLQSTTQLVPK